MSSADATVVLTGRGAHRARVGAVALVAAVLAGVLQTAAPTVVAAAPALSVRVQGNGLVDGSGSAFQLHGVNRSGTEYACVQGFGIFDGPSDDASVAAMASWTGVNAVRVPLNEDCWLGINGYPNGGNSAAQYKSAIQGYVTKLHAHGLYAILELHWSAPGASGATYQEVMPDADHSPTFWSDVATTFKGDPATIFDVYNEPTGVSWTCWRDGCPITNGRGTWQVAGMQSLVTAVRNTGATNVVMVGGLSYANDITGFLPQFTYKPSDPTGQLAASFHVYNFNTCKTVSCWDSEVAPVAAQMPVVAGEIGEDDGTASFINSFMAWAEPKSISYLAWTWDTWGCGGAVLISNYNGTPCAGFGAGYKAHLATLPTGPASLTYPVNGQTNVNTTKPFTWSAATGAQGYILVIGTTHFGSDLVNSGVLPAATTSFNVPSLPGGPTLYATLLTRIAGTWSYRDINFTAAAGQAMFTNPVNGQTNVNTTMPFTWSAATGAQGYILVIGATHFGSDLVNSGVLPAATTSFNVPSLPVGPTLYATLLTKIAGTWSFRDVTFTAAVGQATFTYPVNGQTDVNPANPFTWSTVSGAQGYILVVGTTVYGTDLVSSGVLPTAQTSFTVPALPHAQVLYATLLTKVNGAFTRFQLIGFIVP